MCSRSPKPLRRIGRNQIIKLRNQRRRCTGAVHRDRKLRFHTYLRLEQESNIGEVLRRSELAADKEQETSKGRTEGLLDQEQVPAEQDQAAPE